MTCRVALLLFLTTHRCLGSQVFIDGNVKIDESLHEPISHKKSSDNNVRVERSAAVSLDAGYAIWNEIYEDDKYIVPYDKSGVTDESVSTGIDGAVAEFNSHDFCVRLKNINDLNEENADYALGEEYYIHFTDQDGICGSYIGRAYGQPNPIYINVDNEDCYKKATVLRLLVYTAGFFPEVERPDRDDYIKIDKKNIIRQLKRYYKKRPNDIDTQNLPYDLESITHYTSTRFGKEGRVVFKLKNGSSYDYVNEKLSDIDIRAIKILYRCEGACFDASDECEMRKRYYFCLNHYGLMKDECALTCDFCDCDDHSSCEEMEEGECYEEDKINEMQAKCPLKCGYCGHGCHDYDAAECEYQKNQCDTNIRHMAQVCPKTCGLCIESNLE